MIRCPLINKDIDIGECVTVVDVCEGAVKERVLSDEIIKQKKWKEICKSCKYHDN